MNENKLKNKINNLILKKNLKWISFRNSDIYILK